MKNDNITGLSASEVALRVQRGEGNRVSLTPGKTVGEILRDNLLTFFNLLNLLIAICLLLVGSHRNMLFMGVVLCNLAIGIFQELRAKRTIDRLSVLTASKAAVLRDGKRAVIPVEELVLDDVVYLTAGGEVSADAVLLDGELEVNESLLTGESDAVRKTVGDKLFSGSFVVSGHGLARLTAVGDGAYAAKLQRQAKKKRRVVSMLMKSINSIIRTVGFIVLPIGVILFIKNYLVLKLGLSDAVVSASAAMIGMIPEGLVLLTSIALAVGVIRLGQKRVLVQELYSIEALARVDVICLDKTGTITSGALEVEEVIATCQNMPLLRQKAADYLAAVADENATATALKAYFTEPAQSKAEQTLGFSSARKYGFAQFGKERLYLGAPEFIPGLNDAAVIEQVKRYAAKGKRVLALASQTDRLRVLGLILLRDRLRENAKDTLAYFAEQGVAIKVISGDNPLTVAAAAGQAGLSGEALDCTGLSDAALIAAAEEKTFFGRVNPQQKAVLIRALQENGHHAAMVGDGVNDILAMKEADCSAAMASGSDAARSAAQLVLLDSDFGAMPEVLLQGRRVINNIGRSASLFLVKTCFSAVLALLLVFVSLPYPFAPINLTLISGLTIGLPSFFLALEPSGERVKGSFLQTVAKRALPGGLTVVLCLLVVMLVGRHDGASAGWMRTGATYVTVWVMVLNLIVTCLPMSKRHFALCFGAAALLTGAIFVLPEVFLLLPVGEMSAGAWKLLLIMLAGTAVFFGMHTGFWLISRRKEKRQ